jgi:DNA-directed RNA polymerase subunit K/omega
MEISKSVPNNTITRDLSKLAAPTGNIYESAMIIAKRSNQIAAEIKQELKQKLEEFSSFADTLEETFENREQIEISRYYERLPKPTLLAIHEFEEDKIQVRKIEG